MWAGGNEADYETGDGHAHAALEEVLTPFHVARWKVREGPPRGCLLTTLVFSRW